MKKGEFMKKRYYYLIGLLMSIMIGVLVEPSIRVVKVNGLIDFTMDSEGSFYFLFFNDNDGYSLKKSSNKGKITYDLNLGSGTGDLKYNYTQLEIDKDFNTYIAKENISKSEDGIEYISSEEILKYGIDGSPLGSVAKVNLKDEDEILSEPLVKRIQLIDNDLKIICDRGETGFVLSVDRAGNSQPKEDFSFDIVDYQAESAGESWISDAVVTSDGVVVYTDKRGKIYRTSSNEDTHLINELDDVIPAFLSTDLQNRVYFTDVKREDFCCFNVETGIHEIIFDSDKVVLDKKSVKFGDIQSVYVTADDQYFGIVKNSNGNQYVQFGKSQNMIEKVEYGYPSNLIEILIVSISLFALFVLIVAIVKKLSEKHVLSLTIFLKFAVVSILVFGILIAGLMKIVPSIQRDLLASYKEAGAEIMLNWVDGNALENVDFWEDYSSEKYEKLDKNIKKGFNKVKNVSDLVDVYSVKNGKIYRLYEFDSSKGTSSADTEFLQLHKVPIKYVTTSGLYEKYYGMLKSFETDKSKSSETIEYSNEKGKWLSKIVPIRDESNKVVGLIESKLNYFSVNGTNDLMFMILFLIMLFALMMGGLWIILYLSLKPLKKIKEAIDRVGDGYYNDKISVFGKNQLGDICNSINNMMSNIYKRVSDLALLNEEYAKYTSKEIFSMLGKSSLAEIKINDKERKNVYVLNLDFLGGANLDELGLTLEGYFDAIHSSFNDILITIENNNGFVESFDGFKLVAIFDEYCNDIVKASLQIKNCIVDDRILRLMRMCLFYSNVIVGVIGNEERKTVSVISNEMMLMQNFLSEFCDMDLRHVVTGDIIKLMNDEETNKYRFIGLLEGTYSDEIIKVYELFDERNYSKRGFFDKGLELYIAGDFKNARKAFTEVLSCNREDSVAMHYLKVCDSCLNKVIEGWKGLII